MADLIRSAKPGRDWTKYDLEAYNIRIQLEDQATFFGDPDLPLPVIDKEILTTLEAEDMLSDRNAELIYLLELAVQPVPAEKSAVDDFTVALLGQLSYMKRSRVIHTQMAIPYYICEEGRNSTIDMCLLKCLQQYDMPYYNILLLVQEDKHFQLEDLQDPEPQLIASAIAAFKINFDLDKALFKPKACDSCNLTGVLHSLSM
jgi:hypothetical protein